ncbi:Caprin-2, partial [Dissostichus eleginoides]
MMQATRAAPRLVDQRLVGQRVFGRSSFNWSLVSGKKKCVIYDAYTTVSDLAESLSPAEEATAQREDSSGAEESEPAPKRQREKQQDISMLMAFDEDQQTEDEKNEMKTYLEDRTKVDKGPLI